jgi:hypothetical protein
MIWRSGAVVFKRLARWLQHWADVLEHGKKSTSAEQLQHLSQATPNNPPSHWLEQVASNQPPLHWLEHLQRSSGGQELHWIGMNAASDDQISVQQSVIRQEKKLSMPTSSTLSSTGSTLSSTGESLSTNGNRRRAILRPVNVDSPVANGQKKSTVQQSSYQKAQALNRPSRLIPSIKMMNQASQPDRQPRSPSHSKGLLASQTTTQPMLETVQHETSSTQPKTPKTPTVQASTSQGFVALDSKPKLKPNFLSQNLFRQREIRKAFLTQTTPSKIHPRAANLSSRSGDSTQTNEHQLARDHHAQDSLNPKNSSTIIEALPTSDDTNPKTERRFEPKPSPSKATIQTVRQPTPPSSESSPSDFWAALLESDSFSDDALLEPGFLDFNALNNSNFGMPAMQWRVWQRIRRIDREQEGFLWNELPF